MNPEENQPECVLCREGPLFIHTVSNNGVIRRLCTDCLLKEHRQLFCAVCFNVFDEAVPPQARTRQTRRPQARITCPNCPSSIHFSCSTTPPSSSVASSSSSAQTPASFFTCPPCSDPNFIFFPKSRVNNDVPETPVTTVASMALVAASKISVASMTIAVAQLKEEAEKKVMAAKTAKLKAKAALENLQDLVIREKASQNRTSLKRKHDDR